MIITSIEGSQRLAARSRELLQESLDANYTRTARVFAVLMLAQWAFAVLIALIWSPYGWEGKSQSINVHVPTAFLLGGALSSLPIYLAWRHPAATLTRHVLAVAQMLWSALLIHLSGGRIETHFHVFGSLAFIAFFRDWKVLVTATLVVSGDHLARGMLWPESVYGIINPEWWRFLEHAFWVVFENVILVLACVRGVQELQALSQRQAETELLSESERQKSQALEAAMRDLERSHQTVLRSEKLAAVGQLAASVGHELRNPLGAVRNAVAYVSRRVLDPAMTTEALRDDQRVEKFFGVIDKELDASSKIISGLLDFARERPPERRPCPLRPLVQAAIEVVPSREGVRLRNEVPEGLPVPQLDGDQFRQVVANLVQNAAEAIAPDRGGEVVVRGSSTPDGGWSLEVQDNGSGMPPEVQQNIFQPLFTTKSRGTGLGLAIVAGLVRRHEGDIQVQSKVGEGTTFRISLPPPVATRAA